MSLDLTSRSHMDHSLPLGACHTTPMDAIEQVSFEKFHGLVLQTCLAITPGALGRKVFLSLTSLCPILCGGFMGVFMGRRVGVPGPCCAVDGWVGGCRGLVPRNLRCTGVQFITSVIVGIISICDNVFLANMIHPHVVGHHHTPKEASQPQQFRRGLGCRQRLVHAEERQGGEEVQATSRDEVLGPNETLWMVD